MKLRENLILREVAGLYAVVPVSSAVLDFNGMLTLNATGAELWRKLEENSDREGLAQFLTEEYNVSRQTAEHDVDAFLQKLRDAGCFTDEN